MSHNQLPALTRDSQKALVLSTLNAVHREACKRIDAGSFPPWWSGLQIQARILDICREQFGKARVEMGRYQQMKQAREIAAGQG